MTWGPAPIDSGALKGRVLSADGPGHQSKPSRPRHPRREADPQSHGTPPEFAGLPKSAPRIAVRRPWRPRNVAGAARHKGGPRVQPHSQAHRTCRHRSRRGCAFAAIPAAAQASPVNLGTVSPFVVLGGSTVTNTGPSVLNGDLGVAPGTALPGFGDRRRQRRHARQRRRRQQAKADLDTAYDVAAGQPVSPGNAHRRPRQPDPAGRRLPLHVSRPAHRSAHPRRRGRPQRAVRVPDRLAADHGVGQLGAAHQRRLAVQRLLAGRHAPRRSAPPRPSRAT